MELDQLDAAKLKGSDLASLVLSLRRSDATPGSFIAAIGRINVEAGKSPAGARLKKAVVAAAIGRPEVMAHLNEHALDPLVVESLEVLRNAAEDQHLKMRLLQAVKWIPDPPNGLPDIVDAWPLSDVQNLWELIDVAASTRDWSAVLSAAPSPDF